MEKQMEQFVRFEVASALVEAAQALVEVAVLMVSDEEEVSHV